VVDRVVEKPVQVAVPTYIDRITVRYQIPNYMWIAVGVEAVVIFSMLIKLVT
jgi:hypothetical protein